MCRRKLTLRVGKADSQSASLGLTLANIGGGIPHPTTVRADVGGQLHLGHNCDEPGLDWNIVTKGPRKSLSISIRITAMGGHNLL